jgi:hypothetical protein
MRSGRVHRRDHENGLGAIGAKELWQFATISKPIVIVIVAASTAKAADGRVSNRQVAGFVGIQQLRRRSSYVTSRNLRANIRPSFGRRRIEEFLAIDVVKSSNHHEDFRDEFGNPLSALRSCAAVARESPARNLIAGWQSHRNGSQLRLSRTQREAAGADAGVAQFTELDQCEFLAITEKDHK